MPSHLNVQPSRSRKMATYSEVKSGLDQIAVIMAANKSVLTNGKNLAQQASDELGGLATTFADVIATIQAYGTTNSAEAFAKAELTKLTAEFQALKSAADAMVTDAP